MSGAATEDDTEVDEEDMPSEADSPKHVSKRTSTAKANALRVSAGITSGVHGDGVAGIGHESIWV